jgi:hypothetical protein
VLRDPRRRQVHEREVPGPLDWPQVDQEPPAEGIKQELSVPRGAPGCRGRRPRRGSDRDSGGSLTESRNDPSSHGHIVRGGKCHGGLCPAARKRAGVRSANTIRADHLISGKAMPRISSAFLWSANSQSDSERPAFLPTWNTRVGGLRARQSVAMTVT